ncbi:terminase gpA endonuclease subunit [Vibrio parahaemolyticus]|uniref:terminase gpA endonuclease subunit n=1 Tax=Vibrio parahaemolyticus TaxID=670 RepID=UPI00389211D7
MEETRHNEKRFIQRTHDIKSKKPVITVSEWAESKRELPRDVTVRPGKFKFGYTPFWREVADNMSVSSTIVLNAVMKGVQLGYTTAVLENTAGYYIDENPAQIMLVSATDDLIAKTSSRIDHMIDSSGLRHKIFSQNSSRKKGQRSGDTVKHKEFAGGYLHMGSAQSPASLRSLPARILLGDETDAWPESVGKDGDPYELFSDRGNTFGNKRRQIVGSTPLIEHTSKTYNEYLRGDQRRYHIRCTSCDADQPLEFFPNGDTGWGGITFERDKNGRLIESSVGYLCRSCGHKMKNKDKIRFLKEELCHWVPMVEPESPQFRSYQISSLYAPPGQITWVEIVRRFLAAKEDPAKLQVFYNNMLGLPWHEKGDSVRYNRILENKIGYKAGEIPNDVHFLCLTADVHKDWIGVELLGWASNFQSYSINWLELRGGDSKDIDAQMWKSLYDVIMADYVKLNGRSVMLVSAFIDSRYNPAAVYSFCSQFGSSVFPISGDPQALKKAPQQYKYKQLLDYENLWRVDINVDKYKDRVVSDLRLQAGSEGTYPKRYPFFPMDYEDSYFKMFSAEEKVAVSKSKTGQVMRYEWRKRNNNNHAFDCRVYHLCQLDFIANETCKSLFDTDGTNWPEFWAWVEDGGFSM